MASEELTTKLLEFKPDNAQPLGRRAADLLDWCAKKLPGKWIPVHWVVRCVMGYEHTPRAGNEETVRMRKLMSAQVRKVLARDHNRELLHQTGLGVRATVDSADVLKNKLPQRTQRLNNALAQLKETSGRVDVRELPKTKDMEPWRDWYARSVAPVLKTLESANVAVKLLPPGDEP